MGFTVISAFGSKGIPVAAHPVFLKQGIK